MVTTETSGSLDYAYTGNAWWGIVPPPIPQTGTPITYIDGNPYLNVTTEDSNIITEFEMEQPEPKTKMYDTKGEAKGLLVVAKVAGFSAEDLQITTQQNTISIKGELKCKNSVTEATFNLHMDLEIPVDEQFDASRLTDEDLSLSDGLLVFTVPYKKELEPKILKIK
mgnify:CR=1 FL=1